MGLLIPEVFILLLTDTVFMLILAYILPSAVIIFRNWDIDDLSSGQYTLEKKRLLISTIVKYVFVFKIPLFLFFIYTNDKLSNVLTGAMCAAGSINATIYGSKLLYLKILNVFFMSAWIAGHNCNNKLESLRYTRLKYGILLFLILLTLVETILTYLNFYSIDPTAVVTCCSSIYSATSDGASAILSIKPFHAFYIFIASYVLLLSSLFIKKPQYIAISSIIFFFSGTLNLILFTSTYIYELPSHKCPYCILQIEYHYVGYLFYIAMFISTASGINSYIHHKISGVVPKAIYLQCFTASMIYFVLSVFFPYMYYLTNNVWL